MIDLLQSTPIQGFEQERLQGIRPTMGVAVDLGVMGLHNDTVATIELPEFGATMGIHNLFEPSLAPEGGHLFQFLRFLTPEHMADKAEVDRSEAIMVNVMEQVWPGVSDKVVLRRTLVRPIMTAASHRYDQPRPSLLPIQTPVQGLYVVGDATQAPGELSNCACESAWLCYQLLQYRR
jgi:phytoene dehydrogenase-like protein